MIDEIKVGEHVTVPHEKFDGRRVEAWNRPAQVVQVHKHYIVVRYLDDRTSLHAVQKYSRGQYR